MHAFIKQINRSGGGLPKLKVDGPVRIGSGGIEGDRQRNLKYHGGPEKAVLMIAAEIVDELAAKGYPVGYGSLGENIAVEGLDVKTWRKGQRFRLGSGAEIELTTLRQPCVNLDVYGSSIKRELYDAAGNVGDVRSPVWARGGFYARVIREGIVTAGDAVVPVNL